MNYMTMWLHKPVVKLISVLYRETAAPSGKTFVFEVSQILAQKIPEPP